MSHFRVEVNVPKGKLEQFMRATVGPWSLSIKEYVENGEAPERKLTKRGKKSAQGQRASVDTCLTMSGKKPTDPDGLLARALGIFERREAASGIGTVTVKVFRNQLKTEGLRYQLQTRLLHEGYMDYLD